MAGSSPAPWLVCAPALACLQQLLSAVHHTASPALAPARLSRAPQLMSYKQGKRRTFPKKRMLQANAWIIFGGFPVTAAQISYRSLCCWNCLGWSFPIPGTSTNIPKSHCFVQEASRCDLHGKVYVTILMRSSSAPQAGFQGPKRQCCAPLSMQGAKHLPCGLVSQRSKIGQFRGSFLQILQV